MVGTYNQSVPEMAIDLWSRLETAGLGTAAAALRAHRRAQRLGQRCGMPVPRRWAAGPRDGSTVESIQLSDEWCLMVITCDSW